MRGLVHVNPDSLSFVVTVGICAIALVFVAVLTWPRPRLARTRRISLLVLCQVMALIFGAGLLNWQNGFYNSWSSLFGTDTPVAQAAPQPPPAASANPASASYQGIPSFETLKAKWQADGSRGGLIVPITLVGNTTQYALPANIYLPEAYFTDDGATLYPVIEYFAGMPGAADQWLHGMGLQGLLDEAIASKTVRPVIAVLPTANAKPGVDTECLDMPDGTKSMTYLSRDVPWAIAQGLRAQPGGWIAAGFSSGGYCAMNLAFQFPGQYRGAINLSGYSKAYADDPNTKLFADERTSNLNNPYWLLANHAVNSIPLFLGASTKDPTDSAELNKMLTVLPANPAPTVVWVPDGGHNADTWTALTKASWPWVEKQFATPSDQSRLQPAPDQTSPAPPNAAPPSGIPSPAKK